MKIKCFVVADVHSPDAFTMPKLSSDFSAVITLGDISQETMDHIVEMSANVPVFGVLGNHDPEEVYGLINVHCRSVDLMGLRIGGFSGAPKYKEHPNHFTEEEVQKLMAHMPPVDIFVSHAPPLATSKDEDRLHKGFAAFDDYITRHRPAYWIHGHLERNYQERVGETTVIGVSGKRPIQFKILSANL